MSYRNLTFGVLLVGALALPTVGDSQTCPDGPAIQLQASRVNCEDQAQPADAPACERPATDQRISVSVSPPVVEERSDPFKLRALKYAAVALKHRVKGLASYYSTSLDGTLTATGEIFRNRQFTAAHLTLPLGCWIEVTARATGRKIRCRVNDRGPYVKKFCLDLSQAAARALGVDIAVDRHVDIRIIAMPGENPLPDDYGSALAEGGTSLGNVQTAAAR
jgi:rare lipoprotein A